MLVQSTETDFVSDFRRQTSNLHVTLYIKHASKCVIILPAHSITKKEMPGI